MVVRVENSFIDRDWIGTIIIIMVEYENHNGLIVMGHRMSTAASRSLKNLIGSIPTYINIFCGALMAVVMLPHHNGSSLKLKVTNPAIAQFSIDQIRNGGPCRVISIQPR